MYFSWNKKVLIMGFMAHCKLQFLLSWDAVPLVEAEQEWVEPKKHNLCANSMLKYYSVSINVFATTAHEYNKTVSTEIYGPHFQMLFNSIQFSLFV